MAAGQKTDKPVLGIILGDAAGIGPELIAKISADGFLQNECRPLLIGDRRVLEHGRQIAGVDFPVGFVQNAKDADFNHGIPMLDTQDLDPAEAPIGQVSVKSGKTTGDALIRAIELYKQGLVDGIVFGPLNKTALKKGGYDFESEHSMFKHYLGVDTPSGEINVLGDLMTSRVTSHIPLAEVSKNLSVSAVQDAIRLIADTARMSGVPRPRVAVAALNPHAGENGTCGREELDVIGPAIQAARAEGIDASGPHPADTIFVTAFNGGFDAVVTMFHDQGQIALKVKGFDYGVTVAGGIPIPITTPAHGTAYDIAGKNRAKTEATKNAVRIAARMAAGARKPA